MKQFLIMAKHLCFISIWLLTMVSLLRQKTTLISLASQNMVILLTMHGVLVGQVQYIVTTHVMYTQLTSWMVST